VSGLWRSVYCRRSHQNHSFTFIPTLQQVRATVFTVVDFFGLKICVRRQMGHNAMWNQCYIDIE